MMAAELKPPIVWTDPGGCSTCEHCSIDMDLEPFCIHPAVVARYPIGLFINRAIQDFCGPGLKLREDRQPRDVDAN